MISPLLHLSADAWQIIAPLLDYDDVKKLLDTGNRYLAQIVSSFVHSFVINKRLHALDLDSLQCTCKATPYLTEITIKPMESLYRLITPSLPLDLPPTLTKLHADFYNSLAFFLFSSRLCDLVPDLVSLRLRGLPGDTHLLRDLKLPQKLQHLELTASLTVIEEGEITTLPRSLTSLDLRVSKIPPSESCGDWPSHLSTLKLILYDELIIEHLPRSLTHLSLNLEHREFLSSFKPPTGANFLPFPWRRFFPRLTCLSITNDIHGPAMPFLKSVVSPNAYDALEVSDFLSRGFWRSEEYDRIPANNHPLFERIFFFTDAEDLTEACRELAPFLHNVVQFSSSSSVLPFESLQYLPSLAEYDSEDVHTCPPNMLSLTHAYFGKVVASVIEKLQSLEELTFSALCDESGAIASSAKWPSTLKRVYTATVLTSPALQLLPTLLTHLTLGISTHTEWSIIASRLVNLEHLSIRLTPDLWCSSTSLEAIASKRFEHLIVFYAEDFSSAPEEPFMNEFLGKHSPLPASLTNLEVSFHSAVQRVPLTILPYLPKQLRILKIMTSVAWNSTFFKTEPHIAAMTPSKLLASLPTGLEVLSLISVHKAPEERQPVSVLSSLPRGLVHFNQLGLFNSGPSRDIIVHLPPRLASITYESNSYVEEEYLAKIRPYLFSGSTADLLYNINQWQ